MRQNPSFTLADVSEMRRVVESNPWATIVSATPEGLVSSHYAVMLDDHRDDLTIVAHVGRPDDLIHGLGDRELLVILQGPHGYISPGWYGDVQAVPTWNYIAVHLSGVPEILSDEENFRILGDLVDHFETRMPTPVSLDIDLDKAARIARGTVGLRLRVTRFDARAKLSQNKAPEVRESIMTALEGSGPYASPELAAEMRRVNDPA